MNTNVIAHNFTHHKLQNETQAKNMDKIREMGKELSMLIYVTCPEGTEKTTALQKVDEAVLWGTESIKREK